jgi:hypothetical protein
VHSHINTVFEESALDLLGEDAFAAYLGERHITNLIARGLDLDQFNGARHEQRTQLRGNGVSLP